MNNYTLVVRIKYINMDLISDLKKYSRLTPRTPARNLEKDSVGEIDSVGENDNVGGKDSVGEKDGEKYNVKCVDSVKSDNGYIEKSEKSQQKTVNVSILEKNPAKKTDNKSHEHVKIKIKQEALGTSIIKSPIFKPPLFLISKNNNQYKARCMEQHEHVYNDISGNTINECITCSRGSDRSKKFRFAIEIALDSPCVYVNSVDEIDMFNIVKHKMQINIHKYGCDDGGDNTHANNTNTTAQIDINVDNLTAAFSSFKKQISKYQNNFSDEINSRIRKL